MWILELFVMIGGVNERVSVLGFESISTATFCFNNTKNATALFKQ